MIRKAHLKDIEEISRIVDIAISDMHSYNNFQWDENYPREEDFKNDIYNGELFVCESNNEVAGVACINFDEPEEYNTLAWSLKKPSMIVHRMAVNPKFRGCGIGLELMKFAEILSLEKGINYMRIDTNSLNTKAQNLFKRCGYNFVGEVTFSGKEGTFYCYEKTLI